MTTTLLIALLTATSATSAALAIAYFDVRSLWRSEADRAHELEVVLMRDAGPRSRRIPFPPE